MGWQGGRRWELFQEEIQVNYPVFECLRLGRLLHPGICIDFISLAFLMSNLEPKSALKSKTF